jgi:16S rRNA (cytosine1402-N4)-methyltransferase
LASLHIPVLFNEVISIFSDISSGVIVDCTTGLAGHSKGILESNPNVNLVCIDRDIDALDIAKENLKEFDGRVQFLHGSYSEMIKSVDESKIKGILADIGVSSLQLDREDRGFGFNSQKLDMRMNQEQSLSAYDVVNYYDILELERVFKTYGEVREYKKLARVIIEARKIKKIESNLELSQLIGRNSKSSKIHPATLVFQGIRIEVNRELKELEELLEYIENSKIDDTKIAIISFHSLEDRIVKESFKRFAKSCICRSDVMRCGCGDNHSKGDILTKKPITPTNEEIKLNPRSRSSKMRVFHKI